MVDEKCDGCEDCTCDEREEEEVLDEGTIMAMVEEFKGFTEEGEDEIEMARRIVERPPLFNKKIAYAGTLRRFTVEGLKNFIIDNGGYIRMAITHDLDYLVVGENPGKKYKDASLNNIKVISEEELLEVV